MSKSNQEPEAKGGATKPKKPTQGGLPRAIPKTTATSITKKNGDMDSNEQLGSSTQFRSATSIAFREEISIDWFKRLLEMKAFAEKDPRELPMLYGYIDSAEWIIKRAEATGSDMQLNDSEVKVRQAKAPKRGLIEGRE